VPEFSSCESTKRCFSIIASNFLLAKTTALYLTLKIMVDIKFCELQDEHEKVVRQLQVSHQAAQFAPEHTVSTDPAQEVLLPDSTGIAYHSYDIS